MTAALNLPADRIGHLVITWHDPTDDGHLCQCDCGEYVRRTRAYLLRARRENRNATCSVTCPLRPNQRTAPAAVPVPVVEELNDTDLPTRPLTRRECAGVPRPCPFVSCRHHLFLDVTEAGGLKLNFPGLEPDELEVSCSLDVADTGWALLEEVGAVMGVTAERVRQLEVVALRKMGWSKRLKEVAK